MNKDKNNFFLEIIRPTKKVSLEIEWVEVQSPTGNFFVGPDHLPLVSTLKYRGKLRYKKTDSSEEEIDVYGGIFSITNNKATAILDI